MFLESSKPSDEDITSYIEAEGLQNWRSSALVTMHIESGKVERKYVTFDPVTWYHLVLGGGRSLEVFSLVDVVTKMSIAVDMIETHSKSVQGGRICGM